MEGLPHVAFLPESHVGSGRFFLTAGGGGGQTRDGSLSD